MRKLLLLFMTLQLVLLGCRHEEPDTPPLITVYFPSDNSNYDAVDTVYFKVSITNDENINTLEIYITDQNNNIQGNKQVWTINKRAETITDYFYINIPSAISGSYYIVFNATDSRDNTKRFVPITLNGIPKVMNKVALFTTNNLNSHIEILDTGFNPVNTIYVNNQFEDGIISSYQQNIMFLSKSGQLSVYDATTLSYLWSVTDINSLTHPFLGHLSLANPYVLVPYSFCIRSYDRSGTYFRTYTIPALEQRPVYSFVSDNYLFVVTKSYNNTPSRMYKFYFNTNQLADSYMLSYDFDPVKIIQTDDDKLFIFGNIQGQVKLYEYYIQENILSQVTGLPDKQFYDAIRVDDQRLIVSMNGMLYQLNSQTYTIIAINGLLHGYDLEYDMNDQTIWIANGNELFVYTYPNYQPVGYADVSDSIAKISILYNHD